MAMPRKSALALSRSPVLLASIPSGEPAPNTVLTSAGTLSNSILATENPPTSQPARVNGTQGAGAVLPSSLIICGLPSPLTAVQYRKELLKPTLPSGLEKTEMLGTRNPLRAADN